MRRRSLCGITLAFLAPCMASGQDTVRVRADKTPVWGKDARLVNEFSIGDLNGPDEYAFGSVGSAAVDAGGGFYVFDAIDLQIRRYDSRGKFVANVGRKGSGPGEYRFVSGIGVFADSSLAVCDQENSRVTLFGADGKVQRSYREPRPMQDDGCATDGKATLFLRTRLTGGPTEGLDFPSQFVRLRRDGTAIDSLPAPAPDRTHRAFVLMTSDGPRWSFPQENVTAPYLPGGTVQGHTTAYRVVVTRPGKPVLVIERPHTPVPLGGVEREQWESFAAFFNSRPSVPQPIDYAIPTEKPVFRDLRSDRSGRIWVHLYAAAERRPPPPRPAGDTTPKLTWKERNTWDVFSPQGAYLGRLVFAAESVLLDILGDRVWLRTKGPDGEDRVSVFRIAHAGR